MYMFAIYMYFILSSQCLFRSGDGEREVPKTIREIAQTKCLAIDLHLNCVTFISSLLSLFFFSSSLS